MREASRATEIVYVAGYGRSGSTLLDILLGSHAAFMSGGELTYLFEDWDKPGRACACGARYAACPLWSQLPRALPVSVQQAAQIVRRFDGRGRGRFPPRGRADEEGTVAMSHYAAIARCILDLAQGQGARYLIDSSKTAGDAARRPLALQGIAGIPVKVIHLMRSPWATWGSVRRGSNRQLEGHGDRKRWRLARAVAGYVIANGHAYHAGRRLGGRNYYRLRYEDLVRNPRPVIEELGRYLGVDLRRLARAAAAGESFKVSHNVGGNRVRLQREITLQGRSRALDTARGAER